MGGIARTNPAIDKTRQGVWFVSYVNDYVSENLLQHSKLNEKQMLLHCLCNHIFDESEARQEGEVFLCPKCGSPNFITVPQGCFSALFGTIGMIAAVIIGGCLVTDWNDARPYLVAAMMGIVRFFKFITNQWTYHRQISSDAWKNNVQTPSPAPTLEVPEVHEIPQDSQPVEFQPEEPSEESLTWQNPTEPLFEAKSNQGCFLIGCQLLFFIFTPLMCLPFAFMFFVHSNYLWALIFVAIPLSLIPAFFPLREEIYGKVLKIDTNAITYTSCSHWSAQWSEIQKIKCNINDLLLLFVTVGQILQIRVDLKDGKTHFKARISVQDTILLEQMAGYIQKMANIHSIEMKM